MLIVDVSKTVGDLAKAIAEKSQELELLKQEYLGKIAIVNSYIESINSNNCDDLDEPAFLNVLTTKIECPHCQKTVCGIEKSANYVMVPKGILRGIEPKQEMVKQEVIPSKPKKGSQKKTCSYCNRTGHSRARCFERLAKDPTTDK